MPVDITLEPRESINSKSFHPFKDGLYLITLSSLDMGILKVDLLGGHGIRGVDRGGAVKSFSCGFENAD